MHMHMRTHTHAHVHTHIQKKTKANTNRLGKRKASCQSCQSKPLNGTTCVRVEWAHMLLCCLHKHLVRWDCGVLSTAPAPACRCHPCRPSAVAGDCSCFPQNSMFVVGCPLSRKGQKQWQEGADHSKPQPKQAEQPTSNHSRLVATASFEFGGRQNGQFHPFSQPATANQQKRQAISQQQPQQQQQMQW